MGAASRLRPAVGLLLSIALSAAFAGAGAAWLGSGEAAVGLSSDPERPAKAPTVEDFVAALSLDPRRADDRVRIPVITPRRTVSTAPGRRPGIPARIAIPSASTAGPVERMGVANGRLRIPPPGRAGWFEGGPRPGELGRAVIVSHVDSKAGPALFYSLLNLGRGTRINVTDRRGDVRRFAIVSRRQIRKSRFPASSVYGTAARPMLVLITCGGPFSPDTGYRDNVILYARAV